MHAHVSVDPQNPGAKLSFFSFAFETVKTVHTSVHDAEDSAHCSSNRQNKMVRIVYVFKNCFALKHVCQTGIMGLYDGLGAGIWRQACKSMETLRIVQFWRDFRCLLNFNEFYILQSADFLCEQQIWIVGDLSWPLQSPCSIAWNTMRFQVFRDTLAKHREVIVGGNSWGHWWWKDVTWYILIWELEVELWFVAIFELALVYLFAFIITYL